MSKFYLFFILIFCINTVWSADYHRTINWVNKSPETISHSKFYPDFIGSVITEDMRLPYWFESIALNASMADVLIKNAVFQPVNDSTLNLEEINNEEIQFQTEIGNSAGQHFLRLIVFPFVKRDNKIERLVEFDFSVNEKLNLLKATANYNWKSTSVLASGKWVKITTKLKGIYKISFDQLKQWGFQNPELVALYGNGGYKLPVFNKNNSFDDLNSYPVWKGKDNAGKDCIFFYSTGNIQMIEDQKTGLFTHQQNYYATETYFYLSDSGNPKTITKTSEIQEDAENKVTSFPNYAFYEKETNNLIKSGSRWFGEHFTMGSSQTVSLTLDDPDLSKQAKFTLSAVAKSSSASALNVSLNGISVKSVSFQPTGGYDTSDFAVDQTGEFFAGLTSKNVQARLTYNASNSSSEAWLDFLAVNYQSNLNMNVLDVFMFRGIGSNNEFPVSEFVLNGANSTTKIIDVTDINNTSEVPAVFANNKLTFKSNSTSTHEYIAFNPTGTIPVPEWVGLVANQNIHAADIPEMIIVTNAALISAANDLADFHRNNDNMTVQVVTPELIYNEFSGGLPDPAGIRNYFRMCYDLGRKSGKNTLKYVLLLGDGSFDNRNILGKGHNLIPTYQSDNSLSPINSVVSDDFFVFLDEDEGDLMGAVDLGIGRIPAFNLDEAKGVIAKIKHYHEKETLGNWRDVVTFIGDDEDGNVHMRDADILATYVGQNYPGFYTDKIYFDAYKQISTPGGEKYPDVNAAITNRVKQGTLIMNYTGHANEKSLAAEDVLDIATINSWSNYNKLPIFVTATCEFSRFDANETSAGEYILLNPAGGGVGLFSTTRLVFSNDNYTLNSKFFRYIFEKDEQGNNLRLGDVMRLSKVAANTGTNQLNFTLLADPAMRLANPEYQVKTTSMDGNDVAVTVDTIRALSVVAVKGFIADANGKKVSSFNGEIIPTVYDKIMRVETLGNANQTPMVYNVQNNIIYKGLASVKDGDFEFSFFVPKDISFKLDKGKILYYAYNETTDAQGYFNEFYIGGSVNTTITDSNGPKIDLFLNSYSFKDGGTVSASSVLLANISDLTGINTSGTGIGHDITAILDGDNSNIMVLNDYFQADKDSYTSGKIVYPLNNLTEGKHTLKLKLWDVLNNSSEIEIRFFVKDDFRIESVACFPNPVQNETSFVFTHNQPDETLEVNLEVFETSGTRIDLIQKSVGSIGTESLPIVWNPLSRNVKMSPGVYIYRITATTSGKTTSGSGRLVFVRR
jgi:hypothetical protein